MDGGQNALITCLLITTFAVDYTGGVARRNSQFTGLIVISHLPSEAGVGKEKECNRLVVRQRS
jgi:hypothetical protein